MTEPNHRTPLLVGTQGTSAFTTDVLDCSSGLALALVVSHVVLVASVAVSHVAWAVAVIPVGSAGESRWPF